MHVSETRMAEIANLLTYNATTVALLKKRAERVDDSEAWREYDEARNEYLEDLHDTITLTFGPRVPMADAALDRMWRARWEASHTDMHWPDWIQQF